MAEKNLKAKNAGQHYAKISSPKVNEPSFVPPRIPVNDIHTRGIQRPESYQELMSKNHNEAVLNKVILMQYKEVLEIEKSAIREIIQKDKEKEKFLNELMVKLELLEREHKFLVAENNSLKEMMDL